MTLVIGVKCPKTKDSPEGILLIGDTKRTYETNNLPQYDHGCKLLRWNIGIFETIIGFSGHGCGWSNLQREIMQINPKTKEELISNIETIIKNNNTVLEKRIRIIFGLYSEKRPYLYYIDYNGNSEEIDNFIIIGSGSDSAEKLFKELWQKNKDMGFTLKFATCCVLIVSQIWEESVGLKPNSLADFEELIEGYNLNRQKIENIDKKDILKDSEEIIKEMKKVMNRDEEIRKIMNEKGSKL